MKVSELTGAQLDYWTARAEGFTVEDFTFQTVPCKVIYNVEELVGYIGGFLDPQYMPSKDWVQGGPLLSKLPRVRLQHNEDGWSVQWFPDNVAIPCYAYGSTELQAICRAVVRSVFGDEVKE